MHERERLRTGSRDLLGERIPQRTGDARSDQAHHLVLHVLVGILALIRLAGPARPIPRSLHFLVQPVRTLSCRRDIRVARLQGLGHPDEVIVPDLLCAVVFGHSPAAPASRPTHRIKDGPRLCLPRETNLPYARPGIKHDAVVESVQRVLFVVLRERQRIT